MVPVPAEGKQGSILIRCCKPEDLDEVQQLFRSGTLEGDGSPLSQAMEHFRPYIRSSIVIFGVALSLTIGVKPLSSIPIFKVSPYMTDALVTHILTLCLYIASFGFFLYGYLERRRMRIVLNKHVVVSMRELGNLASTYRLDTPTTERPYFSPTSLGGFWVAEKDKQIIGFIGLKIAKEGSGPPTGELSRLIVAGNTRGQGVGRQLMNVLYDHARGQGLETLVLTTSNFFNKAALRMYERDGWVLTGETQFEGQRLIVLQKAL